MAAPEGSACCWRPWRMSRSPGPVGCRLFTSGDSVLVVRSVQCCLPGAGASGALGACPLRASRGISTLLLLAAGGCTRPCFCSGDLAAVSPHLKAQDTCCCGDLGQRSLSAGPRRSEGWAGGGHTSAGAARAGQAPQDHASQARPRAAGGRLRPLLAVAGSSGCAAAGDIYLRGSWAHEAVLSIAGCPLLELTASARTSPAATGALGLRIS